METPTKPAVQSVAIASSMASEGRDAAASIAPRALSIRQPWAWAILYAGKRIENRNWYTAYRGEVLIHAGLQVDFEALDELEDTIRCVAQPRPTAYCGALIARARLVDCVPIEAVPPEQRRWAVGPWCFVLDDVSPLQRPIALKGALGIFTIEPRDELRLALV